MGGYGRALKRLVIWAFFASISIIIVLAKMYNIKTNYTQLHRKVSELEREVLQCKKN